MKKKPNIILYLLDDLGYGDVSCLNENSMVQTSHVDALASEGISFTDAHATSSVCTPSRYGLLTGRYNWRSRLKAGVLPGSGNPLIEEGRTTLASMLKEQGYRTAAVGKWHLGMDWPTADGRWTSELGDRIDFDAVPLDYETPIKDGPRTRGFDYFYGMAGSLDQAPFTIIENELCLSAPDHMIGIKGFLPLRAGDCLREHISYGPAAPDFDAQEIIPKMDAKALELVEEYAKEDQPFFLYYPTPAVHAPLVPADEFEGKSGIGPYGDIILQVDDFIGRLTAKLEELGIAEDTIVILTSDNGCSIVVDPERLKGLGHNPSYIFRGLKADIWEGGHRIPLIVRWPGHIAPGTVCDQTVCLTDLFATIAEITGYEYGDDAGEDSVSNLCLWMGEDRKVRDAVVHHSRNGFYSIRKDNWKLEFCAGSGGISFPQEKPEDTAGLLPMQLYDLDSDIGEQHNLLEEYPEKVEELRSLMLSYIVKGRSTPGKEQKNFPAPGKWPGLGWMNI